MNSNSNKVMTAVGPLAMAKKHDATKRDRSHVFTAILFALFLITLLFAITAGTNVYRSLHETADAADNARLGVNLIANTVRANDSIDSVAAGTGPEGQSLVLREHLSSGDYETRLYLYDGYVVQEYSLAGAAYTPDRATQIVESSQFSYTYANGLLSITTDQGTADVALRSVGGGA